MPVSFQEYYFYSLCLKAKLSIIAVKQDTKQDINGKRIKNFDFIINTNNTVFIIDVKGSSRIVGDTKVTRDDIDGLISLKKLYGKNVKALFVFFWTDSKLPVNESTIAIKFKIKAIDVNEFNGRKQKGWNGNFLRCNRDDLKDIWEFIPEFKNILLFND
jgi:hypothetical protein